MDEGHDASPALGGSMQHSQSPNVAEGGAVMANTRFPLCRQSDIKLKIGGGDVGDF